MQKSPGLSEKEIRQIESAVMSAEKNTSGEIVVHLERFCKTEPLFRAKYLFKHLGLSNTRDKTGVLIYIATDDQKFAILGDRGISDRVGQDFWDKTADIMKEHFKKRQLVEGIISGVQSAGFELSRYFPIKADDTNELKNNVSFN